MKQRMEGQQRKATCKRSRKILGKTQKTGGEETTKRRRSKNKNRRRSDYTTMHIAKLTIHTKCSEKIEK